MNLRSSGVVKYGALTRAIVVGLLSVFFTLDAHSQATNYIVDQFDSPDTTGHYVNQNWGTAVPNITWSTNNATTTLGPNNPGSGSAFWQITWPTTGDQIEVTRAFNNGAVVNLGNFSSISFDIMFATNSATDGNGSYGALEVDCIPQSDGWPSTALAIYTSAVSNGNHWIHVTLPVNASLSATGIGLKIQQSHTGANLTGTTAFWIDNIIFSGFTTPIVTGPPQVIQLNTGQVWQRLEFQITNVPSASNPFDPDVIRLDGTFTSPSGETMVVPAFWYQEYTRSRSGGTEYDTVNGPPQWRLRFEPLETGTYSLSLVIQTNNELCAALATNFTVVSNSTPARFGNVGVAPNNQYLQTSDGQALPLNGENVAWWNNGTYDYDTWFASMQNAGEDFARVWMSSWCFGIEGNPGTLNNYALDPAWQLDYVLQLAEQEGIYVQLTLNDYREYSSDFGSDGQWPNNPYNIANGGPCINQNAFFTNNTASVVYQKRLRYLIGRYGYSSHLLAWEFFNEIDHDYSYLSSNNVDTWIASQANWLHTNDPYGHLVTTSLSYASADPQQWALPQLDFLSWHTYFQSGYQLNPAQTMANDAAYYRQTYHKVVQIGEYGTDWHSWPASMAVDPYLRGLRQGIWGGALGGSAGTAMSWWWDSLAPANDYWLFSSLEAILGPTDWGRGSWTNIVFKSGQPLTAIGLNGAHDSLIYLVASDAAWPNGATNQSLPEQQAQTITITGWPKGTYYAEWYDPVSGTFLGLSQGTVSNGNLSLALPNFSADLAGVIYPPPTLTLPAINQNGLLQFQLNSQVGGKYAIEESSNLLTWAPLLVVTNTQGTLTITNPLPSSSSALFFRARQN
ncbi:MAG TPA: DUF5060 domain-containing protein [Pseudomonadales bacterium]|nr:DUF5060 domain-containing protein [Pseudomonadales bacterium]